MFHTLKTVTLRTTVMTGAQAEQRRRAHQLNDAVHAAAREGVIATEQAVEASRSGDAPAAADATVRALEAGQRLAHARQQRCGGHSH